YDQVSDPSFTYYVQDYLLPPAARRALFYDGGNNANGTGNIGMAVGWAEE
ncbi:unnamed protein product, partial [Symbiodinium natans]